MERLILWTALAFCGLCLWLMLRHDWLRWTRQMHEAEAEVIGQRTGWDDGHKTYSARLRFKGEGQVHEVTDPLFGSRPSLLPGTRCRVKWPAGRPDLARIPRPWMWTGVYAVIGYLAGVVAGRLMGWIG